MKEGEDWKICALHASAPVISEESADAYPLKIAEKTLQNLKKRIGEQVYAVEEQYRQAVLADTIAFYIVNLSRDAFEKCQCNSELCASVEEGVSYARFMDEKISCFVAEQDRARFSNEFGLASLRRAWQTDSKEVECEYRLQNKDAEPVWALSVARLIEDIETGDQKAIIYVRDIDAKKRQQMELERKAYTDSMTGLLHKTAMTKKVSALLKEKTEGDISAFIMLDVDDFKHINDWYGHPVGDEVLIRIAKLLKASFRQDDVVSRIGGDEFAVYVTHISDKNSLQKRLDNLLQQVSQITDKKGKMKVSCSIGAAFCEKKTHFEELYERTDSALYASKKNGKNRLTML